MLIRSEKGQGLAEYALILALIAIAAVLAPAPQGLDRRERVRAPG